MISKTVTTILITLIISTATFITSIHDAVADTFTVDTINDSNGSCSDGDCSLRESIEASNTSPGPDVIEFSVSGTSPFTIQPDSALPEITDSVIIDGYSQAGASVNTLSEGNDAVLLIEIDGTNAGSSDGLHISSGSCTVKGLAINRFSGHGVVLDISGENVIEGNFIGTDINGASDLGNSGNGILINDGNNNLVGGSSPSARNIISGNNINGIRIQGGDGARVLSNYIGTSASGTVDLGNSGDGIYLYSDNTADNEIGGTGPGEGNLISGNNSDGISIMISDGNTIKGNTIGLNASGTAKLRNSNEGIYLGNGAEDIIIGGTSSAERNIISGNDLGNGIEVYAISSLNNGIRIMGNYIGTDVTGTVRLGNRTGVFLNKSSNIKTGGTETGAGNLISGNGFYGIAIEGDGYSDADSNIIEGNLIGTDAAGGTSCYNGTGIRLSLNSHYNIVGGTQSSARNIISGNYTGIWISDGEENLVMGNYIGTDAAGTGPLGNTNRGIHISQDYNSESNIVGGTQPAQSNVIAYNGKGIVLLESTQYGNAILGNSIHSNIGLGIDLGDDGVTANDPGDTDTGENALQNFPVLTEAAVCGGSTTVSGMLDSTPSTQFRIEFFTNSGSDTSGYGEGESFFGFADVTTSAAGTASFSVNLPAVITNGYYLTSTATDPDKNTSEFSESFSPTWCPVVKIYVSLQGSGRPETGWQIPVNVGFYPANSGTLVLSGSSPYASYYFSGTTVINTDSATKAYFTCPVPIASGTYDITVDSTTTLLNVKRSVGIW